MSTVPRAIDYLGLEREFGADGRSCIGSRTRKTVRLGSLSSSMMPPWSLMILATSARPRPVPCGFGCETGCEQRETEAGAVRLGCDEWIEQVLFQVLGYAGAVVFDLNHQRQADARIRALHGKTHTGTERGLDDDAALRLVLADRLDGIFDEVEDRLHELVAVPGHRRQRGIVVLDEADAAAEAGFAQAAHGIEHVVDVDGLFRQRALVAEYLHAVDEIADAVGLRANQLRQRAVGVGEILLE